jgi:hypothetical protein
MWDMEAKPHTFQTSKLNGGEFHTKADLPQGQEHLVPTGKEAVWAPQLFWTRWQTTLLAAIWTLAIQPVASYFSDQDTLDFNDLKEKKYVVLPMRYVKSLRTNFKICIFDISGLNSITLLCRIQWKDNVVSATEITQCNEQTVQRTVEYNSRKMREIQENLSQLCFFNHITLLNYRQLSISESCSFGCLNH